jgi:hypothetical protein
LPDAPPYGSASLSETIEEPRLKRGHTRACDGRKERAAAPPRCDGRGETTIDERRLAAKPNKRKRRRRGLGFGWVRDGDERHYL